LIEPAGSTFISWLLHNRNASVRRLVKRSIRVVRNGDSQKKQTEIPDETLKRKLQGGSLRFFVLKKKTLGRETAWKSNIG
jgi:hypothetical protein